MPYGFLCVVAVLEGVMLFALVITVLADRGIVNRLQIASDRASFYADQYAKALAMVVHDGGGIVRLSAEKIKHFSDNVSVSVTMQTAADGSFSVETREIGVE